MKKLRQAQRDLAQAKTNELSAVLGYDLSLVDFDALQEAGPAGAGAGGSGAVGMAVPTSAAPGPAASGSSRSTSGNVTGLPGVPQGQ